MGDARRERSAQLPDRTEAIHVNHQGCSAGNVPKAQSLASSSVLSGLSPSGVIHTEESVNLWPFSASYLAVIATQFGCSDVGEFRRRTAGTMRLGPSLGFDGGQQNPP